jgi:hypothetical protein
MRVGRDGIDFDAELFECVVVIGQVTELGRTDEREVSRIKENDGPFAFQVCVGNLFELAIVISGCLEGFDFHIDLRLHEITPRWINRKPTKES